MPPILHIKEDSPSIQIFKDCGFEAHLKQNKLRIVSSSTDMSVGIRRIDENERISTLETPNGDRDPTSDEGQKEQEADDVW